MKSYVKDIADANTPENLVPDDASIVKALKVVVQCPSGNTSDLLLGGKDAQLFVILKGTYFEIPDALIQTGNSSLKELSNIWVKAGTNGDDVIVLVEGERKI